ncbi:MAG: VCBS repeat-containing protein [Deltaproteobacteria bacterium]|nr:VCBS repeat-containing protein [Deltaproteobacteria bacterium]
MSRHAAVFVAFALILTGCPDDKKRPYGESCSDSVECEGGLCAGGICLDPALDEDQDGLTNALEVQLGSDPLSPDTDQDGLADGEETSGVTNVDTDGDGLADIVESATADADDDCIPDQYDARNTTPDSDLSPMIDVVCSTQGVCTGQRGAMQVECSTGTARCIYTNVPGFANPEVTCDAIDQNCDGKADDGFADRDADAIADCVDTDWDNDTIVDASDNCPKTSNLDQADTDADGVGNACTNDYRLIFVDAPSVATTGLAFPVSVGLAEVTTDGATVPRFKGTVTLGLERGGGTQPLAGTTSLAAGEDGLANTADLVIAQSGTGFTLTASSGDLAAARSDAFDVRSGALASLAFEDAAAESTAGESFVLTVVAKDAFGNVIEDFAGVLTLSATDPQAVLPAPHTFVAADRGRFTFEGVVLGTVGLQTLTATSDSITVSTGVLVGHAAFAQLVVTTDVATQVAGAPIAVTVTARDAWLNVVTDYAEAVTIASDDPQALVPLEPIAANPGEPGIYRGEVTLGTAGTRGIEAHDELGNTGTASVEVTHGAASRLTLTTPAIVDAGVAWATTVTALDAYSNVDLAYAGTVSFGATDPRAVFAAEYTFSGSESGTHVFEGFRMYTAGAQTLVASDPAGPTGSARLTVLPGDAASIAITSAPVAVVAGGTFSLGVELRDDNGNVAPNRSRTLRVTSSDGATLLVITSETSAAVLPNLALTVAGTITVTVTAVDTGLSATTVIEVSPAAATRLGLSAPPTAGAGEPFAATVTAYDAYGNTARGYLGTVSFTSNDTQASLPAAATFQATDAGTRVVNGIVLKTTGSKTLTVSDGTRSDTATIDVGCRSVASYELTGHPASTTAGVAVGMVVTARDPYGNLATCATGTVTVTSGDAAATLPSAQTFAGSGVLTFSGVVLVTAGNQTVTVRDGAGIQATFQVDVVPAAARTLEVALADAAIPAGVQTSATITARDLYGNRATGYLGTVHFASSDNQATLPANTTFSAADTGRKTVTGVLFKTVGNQFFSATDTVTATLTGETTITVQQGADKVYVLTGAPATQTAGVTFGVTLEVQDTFGNRILDYAGTVRFTSTDPRATLPANYTFVAGDQGRKTFSGLKLETSGARAVRATDLADSRITAASTVDVTPAAMSRLTLTCTPSTVVAGSASSCTATAFDAFDNTATGYRGTVGFSATDPSATLPANYVFTASDAGAHVFTGVVLKKSGSQTVTVADGAKSANQVFTVQAGAAASFVMTGLAANTTAGVATSATVTAYDAQGNVATGYTGSATVSSSDASAVFATPVVFAAGVVTVSITFKTAGDRSVTVNGGGTLVASATTRVGPSAAKTLELSALPGSVTAGQVQTLSVVMRDDFGNVATGFTGTATLGSTDPSAVFAPTSLTFAAGDAGQKSFNVTFKKKGSQSVTVNAGGALTATRSTTVNPAAAASLDVTGLPANVTAGAAQSLTATAYDAYANIADFNGSADLVSSDGQATFTTPVVFSNGTRAIAVTFKTAGAQTFTVNAGAGLTKQVATTVAPAAANKLRITSLPATVTAGVKQTLTVSVLDAYDNIAKSYTGTVNLAATDANAAIAPTSLVYTAGDQGEKSFDLTFVTAGSQTITASNVLGSVSSTTTVNPSSNASQIDLAALPGNTTAGTEHTLAVTLKDSFGNVVTNYQGTVVFGSTDAKVVLNPASLTFTGAEGGVGSMKVTFKTAGAQSVTATAGAINDTSTTTVAAAGAVKIALTGPASGTAGTAFSVTVTAYDTYDNVATGYRGKVRFTSNDTHVSPAAVLPADYTFVAGDNGVRVFTNGINLYTAGARTVTATDQTPLPTPASTLNVTLASATASRVALTGPASGTAGTAFSVTVTAYDSYDNVATGYRGKVRFTSNDAHVSPAAVLPADYTYVASDNGVKVFAGLILYTSGARTVTATDQTPIASPASTLNVTLAAAAASRIALTTPASGTAGTAMSVTVTAYDSYDNVAPGYRGVVTFTSNDTHVAPAAVLPTAYTFVAGDAGVRVFTNGVTLYTAGARTVTATDAANLTSTGNVTLAPASAAKLGITSPASGTVGTAFTVTVTAYDTYDNVATGYRGTVKFSTNDTHVSPSPVLPANYAFVAGDNGVRAFTSAVTLYTSGARTVTATDQTPIASPAASTSITMAATTAAALAFVQGPSNGTAGVALSPTVTVEVRDTYGNRVATSGTSIALAFVKNTGRALLTGATASTTSGLATFTALSLDRPGKAYQVEAASGVLTKATSSTFDIAWQAPAVSDVTISTTSANCIDVVSTLSHNLAQRVDLLVEYDLVNDSPDVGYRRATQCGGDAPVAAADPRGTNGLQVGSAAAGYTFRWNALRDLGTYQAQAVRVRVTASIGSASASKVSSAATFDATWSANWTPSTASTKPVASTVVDLNRDGHLDLVIVEASTNGMTYYLGDGNGGFGAGTAVSFAGISNLNAFMITAADTRVRGMPDLLIADAASDRIIVVAVAFNPDTGALTFSGITTISAPCGSAAPFARDIEVANTDSDLSPEIFVACPLAKKVAVLEWTGQAYVADTGYPTITTSAGPWSLASGDIDWDGKLDLAIGMEGGAIAVFGARGLGSPFVQSISLNNRKTIIDIALGDLDRDGVLDIVAADADTATNPYTGQLRVTALFGAVVRDGRNLATQLIDATTETTIGTAKATLSLEVGDLDRDGWLDIATAQTANDQVSMLRSRTFRTGTALETVVATGTTANGANSMTMTDLDHDGWLDLVLTRRSIVAADTSRIGAVLTKPIAECDVTFAGASDGPTFDYEVSATTLGDVDGDGRLDVVHPLGGSYGVGGATIAFGRGNGRYMHDDQVLFTSQAITNYIGLGDLNGDGKTDLAAINGAAVVGFRQASRTSFPSLPLTLSPSGALPAASRDLVVADVNLDRRDDLLWFEVSSGTGAGKLHAYLQRADGKFDAATTTGFALGTNPVGLSVADLNDDGLLDLAFTTTLSGNTAPSVCTLLSISAGRWSTTLNTSNCSLLKEGAQDLYLTRFYGFVNIDSDGIPEIVVELTGANQTPTIQIRRPSTAGLYSVVEDDGSAGTAPAGYQFLSGACRTAGFGELDGDTASGIDIALRCSASADMIAVFDRKAAGSYDPTKPFALFGGYYDSGSLVVGDMNGDQRNDVVNGSTTFPHKPDTSATFDELPGRRYVPANDYGYYSAVADTNGDGFPDLASLAANAKTIQTSLQTAGATGGTLGLPVAGAAYTQQVIGHGATAQLSADDRPDLVFPFYTFNGTGGLLLYRINSFSGTAYVASALAMGNLANPIWGVTPVVGDFDANGLQDVAIASDGATANDRIEVQYQTAPGTVALAASTGDTTDLRYISTVASGRVRLVNKSNVRSQGMVVAGSCGASFRNCAVVMGMTYQCLASCGETVRTVASGLLYPKNDWSIQALAVGDMNRDGLDDIVLLQSDPDNDYAPTVAIFLQSALGTFIENFSVKPTFRASVLDLAIADVDRDGLNDLVASVHHSSELGANDAVEILLNTTSGGTLGLSQASLLESTGYIIDGFWVGDWARTGRPGIASTYVSGNQARIKP